MIEKYYECYFDSDVVLPASSNTQGNIVLSDFISGSNFLGMVAQNYDSFGSDSFDVFHSGAVRFGDAHLLVENQITYKMPLSFHNLKVGDGNFNRLHLSNEEEEVLREEQKQLKQLRSGFINENLKYVTPSYNYAQKSSYDKENRHSEEGGMFGYSALKAGTSWCFKVSFTDEKYVTKVEKILLGRKKLGKSKTAQYGAVTITKRESLKAVKTFVPQENMTYLYVNSRLALINADGGATFEPTINNLGLSSGAIEWHKSFVQTSSYTPYNYKRQTDEYTRLCINKGSVIAIKGLKEELKTSLFVGAFLSEGFGEILVNPSFLEHKNPMLMQGVSLTALVEAKATNPKDSHLIAFLEAKQSEEESKFSVANHVQEVYKKFISPSRSQWGEIRSFASIAKNREELVGKIEDYISDGVAKKQWEGIESKLFEEIKKSDNPLAFTKLLAMIVSKHTKGGNDE